MTWYIGLALIAAFFAGCYGLLVLLYHVSGRAAYEK